MEFLNAGKHSKAALPLLPPKRRNRELAISQSDLSKNINLLHYLSSLRSLPRYEEGRLRRICALGSGTSFRIEKADDEETGTVVIVKTSRLLVQNTQEASTKIINDAILQELKISTWPPFKRHRNIAQTLGFELITTVNNEPILSLVAEFAEQGSLSKYFEEFRSSASCSAWEQRMSFATDVASALEALHSCRVVHGDIKPDNVLIFRNEACGPPLKAKLSDFGSAIVEDTLFPGKKNIALQVYHGTLIYVPPLVRQTSLLPFHTLPACDVFSFGLLLWSIFKGRSFYESSWKQSHQSDREFLDKIGVDGLVQRFQGYLRDEGDSIPTKEGKLLNDAFLTCVVDISWDSSPQLVPSVRDRVLKKAFSKIGRIKSILMRETPCEQEFSYPSNSYLEAFAMDHYVIDGTNEIQWQMQCQLHQHFLNTIKDPCHSAFEKGKVAFRLSSYSAVGIGCKRDINEALDYLLTAAAFENASAQLICHRVFEAHGRTSPVLRPDLLPACSATDSDESDRGSSDTDMEYTDDWLSNEGDQEMEIIPLSPHENEDVRSQIGPSAVERDNDMISQASGSESDLDYALFYLSAMMDQEFEKIMKNGEISPHDYYSWKIRRFEKVHGENNEVVEIHAYDKVYGGIEKLPLADLCDHWTLGNGFPTIEIKVQDGSLLERPLLHHAVVCCKLDTVETLLKLGISPQTQDDSGNTALHIACQHGYGDLTKLLVKQKAKAYVGNKSGSTPLHWLWMFDSDIAQIAELLVKNADADVNATMRASESTVDAFFNHIICGTPLHSAISVRNAKAVQVLIDQGAGVNVRPVGNGETPLELAAMLHLYDIAEILLRHGANIRDERNEGSWVLHHVGRHVQPLRRWLLHGAEYQNAATIIIQTLTNAAKVAELDPESRDEDGQTAFEYAIQEPGEDDFVVEAFLKNGFPLPLNALELAVDSCASNQENAAKVELLLRSNVSLDSTRADGQNTLHTCALVGAARAAYVILNHPGGASLLNAQDNDGDTPLHCTVAGGEVATAKVLIEAGAKIDVLNQNRISVLGSAITEQSSEVASYLLEQKADIWLRCGDWMGCNVLVLAVAVDLDSLKPMLPFLLSTDLVDDDDDDDNNDDNADKRRFPQLHESEVLDAVAVKHGNTVLHYAAWLADYVGVVSLISAGASAKIRNLAGLTAKQEAEHQLRRLQDAEGGQEEHTLRGQNLRKIIGFLT